MKKYKVQIYNETEFVVPKKGKIKKAVLRALEGENAQEANVNLIYMDNADITRINIKYLEHDYPTDVISFALDEHPLEAEIYIGLEVALGQSREYGVPLSEELMRLSIHGVLHCLGYDDGSPQEKTLMTEKENFYLTD